MDEEEKKIRAINAWKRANRRKTRFGSRLMLAFNVPGTREAGTLAMLRAQDAKVYAAR